VHENLLDLLFSFHFTNFFVSRYLISFCGTQKVPTIFYTPPLLFNWINWKQTLLNSGLRIDISNTRFLVIDISTQHYLISINASYLSILLNNRLHEKVTGIHAWAWNKLLTTFPTYLILEERTQARFSSSLLHFSEFNNFHVTHNRAGCLWSDLQLSNWFPSRGSIRFRGDIFFYALLRVL